MAQHVKILGILHIIFSAFGILAGAILLVIFGGLAGLLGLADLHPSDQDFFGIAFLGSIAGLLFLLVLVLSLPGLIGGIGLLKCKPWARILMIVISAMDLLGFPFHTALGIYGLWVLLNPATERLFAAQAA